MNGAGDWGADPEDEDTNRSMQAHATVDKSLDSTRRMMQNLYETEDTGNKTMEMLHDQGEQLHRIEQGLEKILRALDRPKLLFDTAVGYKKLLGKRGHFDVDSTW